MKLSENFTLDEFTLSQTASRHDISNTPPDDVMQALKRTAEGLESVRLALGHPIHISSGYRSPQVNRMMGGAAKSQHVRGEAVDFTCPGYGIPAKIMTAIAGAVDYDQLILEYARWIHISFTDSPRRRALVIDSKGTRAY